MEIWVVSEQLRVIYTGKSLDAGAVFLEKKHLKLCSTRQACWYGYTRAPFLVQTIITFINTQKQLALHADEQLSLGS